MPIFTVTNQPTPIVSAGQGPVLIVNRDLVNQMLIGPDSGIGGGVSSNINEYDIIDPLGSVALSGDDDVYASTLLPNVSLISDVIPNCAYWGASPAQIAASISLAGVSFVQPEQSVASVALAIGAWNLANPIVFPAGATGYELVFTSPNVNQVFVTDVLIQHVLSGGIPYRESYTVSNYPNTDNQFVRIRGNLHGNELIITGQAATTAYLNAIIPGGGQTAVAPSLTVNALFAPLGPTSPRVCVDSIITGGVENPAGSLFYGESFAVAASTDVALGMIQSYTGEAYFNMSLNTAAMDIVPLLAAYTVANGTGNVHFVRFPQLSGNLGAAGNTTGATLTPFALDGFWYRVQADNVTATAGTVNCNVKARDWN